ncbi:hypothetical protein F5X99DRAFT_371357 [Biscogniauxia marginata]|nr:hypothetical protein F5X99DRAFT_371357 [Biscogniauxia marginata]
MGCDGLEARDTGGKWIGSIAQSHPHYPKPRLHWDSRSEATDNPPLLLRCSPPQGNIDHHASSPRNYLSDRPPRSRGPPESDSDGKIHDLGCSIQLIKQPETRPISQEQLVAEVKGIYAGLVMVESKCIEVDNAQASQCDAKLNNEQWQALIALHRTLLHEHHDFFLASQHPSASIALRRLASKYAMPSRMWRHGIHTFLELLRHRLPGSLEHMLTFIYLAYSMMALLYETVPSFEDTWIECLADLVRYRMAIEDDDIQDREIPTCISYHWYPKASDTTPTTGRLYHHLTMLARPDALQQLFCYTRSLLAPLPFDSVRECVMTRYNQTMETLERFTNESYKNFGRLETQVPGLCSRALAFHPSTSVLMILSSALPTALASPIQDTSYPRDEDSNSPLAFNIIWYTCLLGAVSGYVVLSVYHRDAWSFLGLGMWVSTWSYLIMVSVGDVPLDVIVSAGIVCAVLTYMWMSYDFRKSGMRQSRQQLAKYCVVIGAVLMDVVISWFLAPVSSPLLGAQKPPSLGLMIVILAVPCATLSTVLFKAVRTVGAILAEPDAQLPQHPTQNL